jgi:hypothetical protein
MKISQYLFIALILGIFYSTLAAATEEWSTRKARDEFQFACRITQRQQDLRFFAEFVRANPTACRIDASPSAESQARLGQRLRERLDPQLEIAERGLELSLRCLHAAHVADPECRRFVFPWFLELQKKMEEARLALLTASRLRTNLSEARLPLAAAGVVRSRTWAPPTENENRRALVNARQIRVDIRARYGENSPEFRDFLATRGSLALGEATHLHPIFLSAKFQAEADRLEREYQNIMDTYPVLGRISGPELRAVDLAELIEHLRAEIRGWKERLQAFANNPDIDLRDLERFTVFRPILADIVGSDPALCGLVARLKNDYDRRGEFTRHILLAVFVGSYFVAGPLGFGATGLAVAYFDLWQGFASFQDVASGSAIVGMGLPSGGLRSIETIHPEQMRESNDRLIMGTAGAVIATGATVLPVAAGLIGRSGR